MAGTHQYITYSLSDVKELFDSCIIPAKLIDVHPAANTVDINTDMSEENPVWGRINNVPVFYHCPNSPNVGNGHEAMSLALKKKAAEGGGDVVVLVLCENVRDTSRTPTTNQLYVIGFQEGLQICEPVDVLVVNVEKEVYLVWDLVNNEPLTRLLSEPVASVCVKETFNEQFGRIASSPIPKMFEWGVKTSIAIPTHYEIKREFEWEEPSKKDQVQWSVGDPCGYLWNIATWVTVANFQNGELKFGMNGCPYWPPGAGVDPSGQLGVDEVVFGYGRRFGDCDHVYDVEWPESMNNPPAGQQATYTSSFSQKFIDRGAWSVHDSPCPPWAVANYQFERTGPVECDPSNVSVQIESPAVGQLQDYGWGGPFPGQIEDNAHPGDMGTRQLSNKLDVGNDGYIKTEMSLSFSDTSENENPYCFDYYKYTRGCTGYLPDGAMPPTHEMSDNPSVSLTYTYKTHFGQIDSISPVSDGAMVEIEDWQWKLDSGDFQSANFKYATGSEEDLHVQVLLFQRKTTKKDREISCHGVAKRRPDDQTEDYTNLDVQQVANDATFESYLEQLVELYYSTRQSEPEFGINPTLEIEIERGTLI